MSTDPTYAATRAIGPLVDVQHETVDQEGPRRRRTIGRVDPTGLVVGRAGTEE
ncbi:hypothetical protein [Nocardia sp. CA-290969]|uniref:hypothetical protein n=1 Tax=Nocardia sp. CA-290969 TaxID=3239986 RepID=UPI003D8CAE91